MMLINSSHPSKRRQIEPRQWIGIDISPTACRVMAKRLRDVCALPESKPLWRAGRGFVVREAWSGASLRARRRGEPERVC
jgi:hypothetical protein